MHTNTYLHTYLHAGLSAENTLSMHTQNSIMHLCKCIYEYTHVDIHACMGSQVNSDMHAHVHTYTHMQRLCIDTFCTCIQFLHAYHTYMHIKICAHHTCITYVAIRAYMNTWTSRKAAAALRRVIKASSLPCRQQETHCVCLRILARNYVTFSRAVPSFARPVHCIMLNNDDGTHALQHGAKAQDSRAAFAMIRPSISKFGACFCVLHWNTSLMLHSAANIRSSRFVLRFTHL